MFPNTPLLGLTTTATKATQKKLEESLGMINATEILINPNRSNIYLSSSRRGNRGDELGNILDPLVQDLRAKRMDFPLTKLLCMVHLKLFHRATCTLVVIFEVNNMSL